MQAGDAATARDQMAALLPAARPPARGVTLRRLREPEVILRSYAVTRRGHAAWPPLALVLRLVQDTVTPSTARRDPGRLT